MKTILIVLLVMMVLGLFENENSFAEDWYVFEGQCREMSQGFYMNLCVISCQNAGQLNSPSSLIKYFKETIGCDYKIINDKTVNGKVVEVTMIVSDYQGSNTQTFYRLSRCQEVARKLRQKEKQEQDRYK
jgi:hypothetical protein